MPTFQCDTSALLWDATAVSNAFLCEFMPAAPDGYVKVYLYGLMYAHGGMLEEEGVLDDLAKALEMHRADVEQALRYWERCRLLSRVQDQPPVYRFASVQQALLMKQSAPQDRPYEEFARALCDLFGSRRQLHGSETVLAYEWVEQQKLPPEVVIMLIRHMISTRGIKFPFKDAQKVVNELCEQNARTPEAAEAVFSRSEAAWKGAKKILSRFNVHRAPTMDEIDLYVKWTTEWGFAPKAVESACAETTKGDPSFAYLDKILQGIRERSGGRATTAAQVEKQIAGERDETVRVREMLSAFGMKAPVVDEGRRLVYRDMLTLAEHDVVLLAAREVGKRRGAHSLDDVTALLTAWREKGLSDAGAVSGHLDRVAGQNRRLKALFNVLGRECGCTQANRELLVKWSEQWRMPDALVELAAEYARNVEKPMPYMDKVLCGWHDENIITPDAAREEHQRFVAMAEAGSESARIGVGRAGAGQGVKRVVEQQYSQRTYDPEEYDGPTAEQLREAMKQ